MRRLPLTLSGLVLAGNDDTGGIVTALEMTGMDLAGTQIVVLSACDTARGTLQAGQGVFGLTRALLEAGAETVIASLWRIDDAATGDFMAHYYEALENGHARIEALRDAAKAERSAHAHPYFWAPFVAYGLDKGMTGAPGAAIEPPRPRARGIVTTPMSTVPIQIGPR
jgi:CHAT domain-containing protein